MNKINDEVFYWKDNILTKDYIDGYDKGRIVLRNGLVPLRTVIMSREEAFLDLDNRKASILSNIKLSLDCLDAEDSEYIINLLEV